MGKWKNGNTMVKKSNIYKQSMNKRLYSKDNMCMCIFTRTQQNTTKHETTTSSCRADCSYLVKIL